MENIITDIIKVAVGTFFALIPPTFAWWLNERSKRVQSEYLRKEEKYIQLIKSLEGFYESSRNRDLINQFLLELKLCWLYCPDDVIKKANKFLETVENKKNQFSEKDRELALGEFIISIRKDLISRRPIKKTYLTIKDFKHLKANARDV